MTLATRHYLLFLVLLIFTPSAFSQVPTRHFLEPEALQLSAERVPFEFDQWNFPLGGLRFEIDRNGTGLRLDPQRRPVSFRIKIEKDEEITRVYYAEYKSDLILLCEVEAGDYGGGFVVRLDSRTLKQKWRAIIPAFNITRGLIEEDSAYLAASGFAARLNLTSGQYGWKHEQNFFRKYSEQGEFNVFELPVVAGDEIILTEDQEYSKRPSKIRFNKKSGKVIKMEKSPYGQDGM